MAVGQRHADCCLGCGSMLIVEPNKNLIVKKDGTRIGVVHERKAFSEHLPPPCIAKVQEEYPTATFHRASGSTVNIIISSSRPSRRSLGRSRSR